MAGKPPREGSHLTGELRVGWSRWIRIMSAQEGRNMSLRSPDHCGYQSKISADINIGDYAGVYEFGIPRKGRREYEVMYVGQSQSLKNRIKEYMRNGSHKSREIDDELRRGNDIYVRIKYARNPSEAIQLENELLDKFNYQWNKSKNVSIARGAVEPEYRGMQGQSLSVIPRSQWIPPTYSLGFPRPGTYTRSPQVYSIPTHAPYVSHRCVSRPLSPAIYADMYLPHNYTIPFQFPFQQ